MKSIILALLCLIALNSAHAQSGSIKPRKVSLQFRDTEVHDVLDVLASEADLNIIASKAVQGAITLNVENIEVREAIDLIVDLLGFAYYVEHGLVRVVTLEEYQQRFGKPFKDRLKTRVVKLRHANAEQALKAVFSLKSKDGNVIADQRSNSLVLVDLPGVLAQMDSVLAQVDVALAAQTFALQHATAANAGEIVKTMLSPGGKVEVAAAANQLIVIDAPERLERIAEFIKSADAPSAMRMEIITLQYAKAEDVAAKLKEALTPGVGSVLADKATNKLFVRDLPEHLPYVQQLVQAFDQKTRQVLIEAKIIQIVLSDEYKMGVDWHAVSSRLGGVDLKGAFRILSDTDAGVRAKTFGMTSDAGTLTTLIEALQSVGATDLLSNPRITCVDGQEARFLVGSTIPYKTFDFREDQGVLKTFEKVVTVEVGVKLNVTPLINEDGFITMKIRPEVSEVTSYIDKLPVIDKSESETTVMIKDGVTIVIGGLIKDQKIVNKSQVPVLGSIPILGFPFRSTSTRKVKTELVILLQPQIISGDQNILK
jgi:general secretion pathway protein D